MFFKSFSSLNQSLVGLFFRMPGLLITIAFLNFIGTFLLISWQGIGLTHDSGIYVLSVETLWHKGLMLDHTGQVLKLYPPFYVWLLSLYSYTFLSLYQWAACLNALAYSLILYYSMRMAMIWFKDFRWVGIVCLWIVFSVPLLINAYFLWSELIFIAFSSAILYLTYLYIRREYTHWILILMSMLSMLSIMQRYIGVFLVVSVFFCLLLSLSRPLGILKAVLLSSVYALPSLLFFMGWMYRNYLLTGRTDSYDEWYVITPFYNLKEGLISIATFFIPDELPAVVLLCFSIGLIGLIVYAVIKDQSEARLLGRLLLAFVFSYLILFIVLNSILYIGPLDDRYMSPLCPPLILLTINAVVFFAQKSRVSGRMFYHYALYGFLSLISIYSAIRFGKNVIEHSQSGSGYQSQNWKKDEIVRYIKKENASTLILSNNPMPFILVNGQEAYAPVRPLNTYASHARIIYVKWAEDKALGYLTMHQDLGNDKKYRLHIIKSFQEGEVYEIQGIK